MSFKDTQMQIMKRLFTGPGGLGVCSDVAGLIAEAAFEGGMSGVLGRFNGNPIAISNDLLITYTLVDWVGFPDPVLSPALNVVSLKTFEVIGSLELPPGVYELRDYKNYIGSACCSPCGEFVVAAYDNFVLVWNLKTMQLVDVLPHDFDVGFTMFLPDGLTILTSSRNHVVRFWDAATFKIKRAVKVDDHVHSATCSPDGLTILTVGFFRPKVNVWDAKTLELKGTLDHKTTSDAIYSRIYSASYSPDGSTIVTTFQDTRHFAIMWNAATLKVVSTIDCALGYELVWSGDYIFVEQDNGIARYTSSWEPKGFLEDHFFMPGVAKRGGTGRLWVVKKENDFFLIKCIY